MDHMRISVNEPSSVMLSQIKWFQNFKNSCPKVPKQAEVKRDGEINPEKLQFQSILYGKVWCSQNATNQPKSSVDLC